MAALLRLPVSPEYWGNRALIALMIRNKWFPIAESAAASAGFPILIWPLKFDAMKYQWDKKSQETVYYLWDGGVYDNLGLEALYKPDQGLVDTDFLVPSNASCPSGYLHRNGFSSAKNLKRLQTRHRVSLWAIHCRHKCLLIPPA